MILVVGSTGQVGGNVVLELARRGLPVRALVRRNSPSEHLAVHGVQRVQGDLMNPRSLEDACAGVQTVIATATAHIPRFKSDDFRLVDDLGYDHLMRACNSQRVRRFVFCSGAVTRDLDWIPLFRLKRLVESKIVASDMEYIIVRAAAFMDIAFVLLGSLIPIAGTQAPTIRRPYSFAARHIASVQHSIERDRVAQVPGKGDTTHAFISASDVAALLVAAALSADTHRTVVEVGGPELLSWMDAVRLYERILGVPIRTRHTPAFVYRALFYGFSAFSAPAANLMAINWLLASTSTAVEDRVVAAARFGITLTTANDFLSAKYRAWQRDRESSFQQAGA